METDDDSRSSSNSSSSNSSSNGPASPAQEPGNESNDQAPQAAAVEQHSRSSSRDSGSFQEKTEATNQSMSPANGHNIHQSKEDEEELELSDIDDESSKPKKADISHEDLSDISDLEESNSPSSNFTDLRQKLDKQRMNGSSGNEGLVKSNDEDELDFEDDEVREVSENPKKVSESKEPAVEKPPKEEGEEKSDAELESGEELEDGEVTDGDDKRPEESEPKAVCRFFTRGQCTWGMSCRFLHPGTTDKGNYTMFDMVRPIPVPQSAPIIPQAAYDYRAERPPIHHLPPHAFGGHPRIPPPVNDSESAWERGLRTAKEMMRKASKRKEQDIDFDEKKMNLSGPPDELEKDPYYVRGSPEPVPIVSVKATPPYERIPRDRARYDYSPPPKFARGAPGHFEEDPYGRVPRYRELPAHRMPHYEDDDKRRMVRSNREVIVEKADEWSDPWARKSTRRGSAGRERGRGRERSYSSSFSSSSASSRSRSSSESSGSPSAPRRKRYSNASKERVTPRKTVKGRSRSTSLKKRHATVKTQALEKGLSPVATLKRKKQISPPQLRQERVRTHKKKRDSSSGTGSSTGSESGSESYSSSTSDSKGKKKREKIVVERKASSKGDASKKRATPTKDDKKASLEKAAAAAKIKSTRREELLKQLKAVEDAIARKKSKI